MPRPELERPVFRLKLRSDIWQIEWTEGGKTRRKSTGCSSEHEAGLFLAEFETAYGLPDEPDRKTIAKILEGYLSDRKGQVTDFERLVNAASALKQHIGWIEADQIVPSTTRRYAELREAATGTIVKELGTLSAALNWAYRERWLDVKVDIKKPSKPEPKDRWLTEEEASRLVRACATPHVRLFVLIALNTAARKGAIQGLTWDRVDFDRRRIDFNDPDLAKTKKGRAVVPINATLLAELRDAHEVRTTDHVLEWAGRPAGNIKKGFARAAQRAKLKDVTPHVLRHTAATRMAMNGVPMEKISKILGHRDITTTSRIYAHHHPDWLTDATEVLG